MLPRTGSHRAIAILIAATILMSSAAPALAAPNVQPPKSLVARLYDWVVGFSDYLGLERTRVTANDSAAPWMDPNGQEATPPLLLSDDPEGNGDSSTVEDGEAAPWMDPNG